MGVFLKAKLGVWDSDVVNERDIVYTCVYKVPRLLLLIVVVI